MQDNVTNLMHINTTVNLGLFLVTMGQINFICCLPKLQRSLLVVADLLEWCKLAFQVEM